jgi:hypothetical protein
VYEQQNNHDWRRPREGKIENGSLRLAATPQPKARDGQPCQKANGEHDRREPTGQPQLQPVVVSVVHPAFRKKSSRREPVINRHEGSKSAAEWQIGHSGLRRNLGNEPANVINALFLRALSECNESKLKYEEQRGNAGTNRKPQ